MIKNIQLHLSSDANNQNQKFLYKKIQQSLSLSQKYSDQRNKTKLESLIQHSSRLKFKCRIIWKDSRQILQSKHFPLSIYDISSLHMLWHIFDNIFSSHKPQFIIYMNYTKQSEETRSQLFTSRTSESWKEDKSQKIRIPQAKYDPQNTTQTFYKSYSRGIANQLMLKHGYKVFKISRAEQDLAVFCLSLLQFEAQFPLRFFLVDVIVDKATNVKQKDVWLQTQFLVSSTTTSQDSISKELKLENKIYRFFNESLIPLLVKFKEERICWEHMISKEYTDQRVIDDFNDYVVKRLNKSFKAYCKST